MYEDYLSRRHRPEGVLALSCGLLTLGLITVYRSIRQLWEGR